VDISPDEIRKMVAKFLKELASNTNPKKAPRLLNLISEEKIRALAFMRKLKFVTDPEFKDKYIEAERRRKIWFDENGWEFTPNVDPTELPLMSYDTVADVNGQTEQVDEKHDAFVAFMGTQEGPLRLAEYDKMICSALVTRCFRQVDDQLHHQDVRRAYHPGERLRSNSQGRDDLRRQSGHGQS
jgi:hypothetical protein